MNLPTPLAYLRDRLPSPSQAAKALAALLLLSGALQLGWHLTHQAPATPPAFARERAQLEHERRADSAAAFTAGRLYQQRLDADKLRKQDETHDKSRPAAGPMELPDLYPTR